MRNQDTVRPTSTPVFRFTAPLPPKSPAAEETFDPDHEYEDSTETRLDHTRPPHHDEAADKLKKHKEEPQISIGDA
ncbi:hypothetical protein PQR63_01985 [Herbaspirillum rhizosphaerae]|uniref:Uncharacterized protein n=1 Tax=Herbaspirillum rhizosphaerae TaxID=346179 RepID=A0ABW8Z229_9BURK